MTGQSLGQFLQSRRVRVSPADVGLYQGRRRRVQGLRREELAGLAGLSTDYYARLEQGRHSHPSPGVLDAVADVLRLSPAERDYLQHLARPAAKPVRGQAVRPETMKVMWALGATPAALVGPRMDILASNSAARRLYADFDAMPAGQRNAIRWMLSAPRARELHGDDWAAVASELIGMLRLRFGRQPQDAAARRLVAELSAESGFFRRVWSDQAVSAGNRPVKRFHHPEAGTIDAAVEILNVTHSYDQHLVVLVPAPGSADDRAWRDVMGRTADPAVTAITDMTGRG
jgi:transcriptional regulator with XRE-family HTH domain